MTTETNISKSTIHRNSQKDEGFVRLDLYLDKITYNQICFLAKEFGYDLDKGKCTEGVVAVITHAVERMTDNRNKIKNPRATQQRILLAHEILMAIDNGLNCKEIAESFNKKRKLRYQLFNKSEKSWTAKSIAEMAYKLIKKSGFPDLLNMGFCLTAGELQKELSRYTKIEGSPDVVKVSFLQPIRSGVSLAKLSSKGKTLK